MADNDKKRYYWLKLQKDFFKRHDIRIIESMPNGKDYILFYLKLLCESTAHEGNLRFSDTIPYNEEMLSTITNTNVDIVRSAIKIFHDLHMIEIMDDGTYYMNEIVKLIGSETGKAKRMREYRKQINSNATLLPHCSLEIEKEIEIDIELEKDNISTNGESIPKPKKEKPVKHKYGEYKHILLTDDEMNKLYADHGMEKTKEAIKYLDEAIEMKGYKYKSHYLALKKWVFDAVSKNNNEYQKKNDVHILSNGVKTSNPFVAMMEEEN